MSDLTLARALHAGWKPSPITPKTLHCQAGCGRAIVVDQRQVTGFICVTCRRSYTGFLARQRRARKAAQAATERREPPARGRAVGDASNDPI